MKEKKLSYEQPKILASYKKEELEAIIRPHGGECDGGACGPPDTGGGGGCGGGGSFLKP
jgi:hypothetical protein